MKISVVVPAFNEQDNIIDTVERIEANLRGEHELIIINDHSTDRTGALVREMIQKYPNLKLVDNLRSRGFANALRTGFDSARNEAVIPVMADLCDDLGTIQEMLARIEQGYDVVCGARYIKGGARLGGPKLKAFLSRFAGRSMHFLVGIPTNDLPNSFKMYRKNVIEIIASRSGGFEISMEMVLKAYFYGFRITEVPTVWRERTKGKSSFKVFKMLPNYLKLYIWALWKRFTGKKCLYFL